MCNTLTEIDKRITTDRSMAVISDAVVFIVCDYTFNYVEVFLSVFVSVE